MKEISPIARLAFLTEEEEADLTATLPTILIATWAASLLLSEVAESSAASSESCSGSLSAK